MLTQRSVFLALLFAALAALAQQPRSDEKPLDNAFLRDYAATRGFMLGRPTRAQPTPDGRSVLFLRAQPRIPRLSLFEFSVETGQTRELVTPEQVLAGAEEKLSPEEKARRERMRVSTGGFTDFQLSQDGSLVLLSLSGKLHLLQRATGQVEEIKIAPGVLDPQLAPDGKSVGYVRAHDVYVYDFSDRKERRITHGGTELVSHGLAEFVAQEEMDRHSGYWWSPDSRSILYEEADASEVEVWYVADPARPEQAPLPSRYPRPGKANVKVRLGIVPVRGGKTVWLRWDAANYPYFTHANWHKTGGLTISVQARDQKELRLLRVNPKTGATAQLVAERDPAWVNLDPSMPRWFEDGSGFLWTSEREGAWQLEMRGRNGSLQRVIVPPSVNYQGFVHLDTPARQVYFRASNDPTQTHLFRIPADGGAPEALTKDTGLHGAAFAKNGSIYVHSMAAPTAMPKSIVRRLDGALLGELPSVAETPPPIPQAEFLTTRSEPRFHALIVRPRNFDSSKRYPVIVSVYGGPHANVVQAAMTTWLQNQWLADQGFIVVALDNRGTPRRGREWERAIGKRFGSVPLEDQVVGLKALGEQFPALDLKRVGITGWSFGGYMSALAVLRRPDVFHAAVAGAPVTDWLDYDTHYTERYLGFPEADADAYREASLLTYAEDLKRPLLLIHGTSDDNVYFRHSLKLAQALFRAGKHFELLPLSSSTHMTPDPVVMERRWERAAEHFHKHLGKPEAR